MGIDLVDDAVLQRLLGGHEVVAVGIPLDLLNGLAGILGQDLVQHVSGAKNEIGADLDIGCLTLGTTQRLVDHDLAVRQGDSLALCTCGEQESAHGGGHTDADGGHVTLDEIHGVVDGHTGGDGATGAIDIEGDVLVGILCLQEKKLSHNEGGGGVIDLIGQEDDAVVEQAGVDVVSALAAAGLLDHRGNEVGLGHAHLVQIVHHVGYLTFI